MPSNKELTERVDELEERVEELERHKTVRWDAITIIAIWVIAAFLITFSPYGKEHVNEVLGTAGTATAIVAFWL